MLSPEFLIPGAIIAATLGSYGAYGLGDRFGHRALLRWGWWFGITAQRLGKTHRFFARYGALVILAGRFIVPLRQLQGYVAGSAEMGFRRFAFWSLLGASAWILAWGMGAWWVAESVPLA